MISEIMATGASQQQLEAEIRVCCILQVKMWPIDSNVPLSTSGLLEVIKVRLIAIRIVINGILLLRWLVLGAREPPIGRKLSQLW